MTSHPEGETRKDRRRQWIAGCAVVLFLVSATGNVVQSALYHSATNDKLNTTTSKLNTADSKLQSAAKYDADVEILATQLEGQLAALCVGHVPACPTLPPLP